MANYNVRSEVIKEDSGPTAGKLYENIAGEFIGKELGPTIQAAGLPGKTIGFLFNVLKTQHELSVNIKENGGGFEAFIPATGQLIADTSLKAVVSAVIATGAVAVGATAGVPLTVAVIVGTEIWFALNHDSAELWQKTVTNLIQRVQDDGARTVFQEEIRNFAGRSLDFLDGAFGRPGNTIPVSDLITRAADWFDNDFTSPIVFDLDGNGLDLVSAARGVHFDIDADGFAEKTGWVAASDAFLVHDRNGNGVIDSQQELFGTDAVSTAAQKLQALDTNVSGFLDPADASWAALRLWRDLNQDGVSQAGELFTLESQGVARIAVATTDTNTLRAGNRLDWQANWYKGDGSLGGGLWDVLFETRNEDSWFVGGDTAKALTVHPETLLLPLSRGYGVMKSLHLAAGEDAALLGQLRTLDTLPLSSLASADQRVHDLLMTWAGTGGIAPESGGRFYNQQSIAFLEKLFGHDWVVAPQSAYGPGSQFPTVSLSTNEISDQFGMAWQTLKTRLLVQGPLQPVFENTYYSFAEDKLIFGDTLSGVLARAQALVPATDAASYWQEVGLVLVVHADQFGGNVTAIRSAVNAAAGAPVAIFENWLRGQAGDEHFEGSRYSDRVDLGTGNDTVTAGTGDDLLFGGAGNDSLSGDAGDDTLAGQADNDVLLGDSGQDMLLGGDGLDHLLGGNGNDVLIGEAGNDTLTGGDGIDTLVGGPGADIYSFRPGDLGAGGAADRITDFSRVEGDKILLSGFGLAATGFVGVGPFTPGGAREFGYAKLSDAQGAYTLVRIDYGNNGTADREIRLYGVHLDLAASDFLFA